MSILEEIKELVRESRLNQKNIIEFIFISYMVIKYDVKIDNKYENFAVFISYIKDNLDKKVYSKNELDLINKSLTDLLKQSPDVNIKKIIKFIISHSREEYLDFIRLDLSNVFEKGNNEIPEALSNFILYLLKIKKGGTLLDLECGRGNFLVYAGENSSNISINGYTNDINSLIDTEIRMLMLNCDYQLDLFTSLDYIADTQYDGIFFSSLLTSKFSFDYSTPKNITIGKNNSSVWYFVDRIISLMTNKSKAVLIFEKEPMFKKNDSTIREYLIKNGLVEAIIELPKNLFENNQNENIMLVLSKSNERIKLLDARNMITLSDGKNILNLKDLYESYENVSGNCILRDKINFEEKQYSFIPSNYFSNITSEMRNPALLKSYITIQRGFRGNKEVSSEEYENCYFIKLSDIYENRINYENLEKIKYEKKMDKHLLKNNDILVTARGSRFECALINIENNIKFICSENFYVIRVENIQKLNPCYLVVYMNSSLGNKSIFNNQIQNTKLIINSYGLLNTYVDLIPLEKQKEIAKLYLERETIINETHNKIESINDKINKLLKGETD